MYKTTELIDRLKTENNLSRDEYLHLIKDRDEVRDMAAEYASSVRDGIYGKEQPSYHPRKRERHPSLLY